MPEPPFSLLTQPWLPVLRASGARDTIRPAAITDAIDSDPVVALDWPRPDLRVACLELLIGLLATACPPDPDDSDDWLARWQTPPTPDALDAAFTPLAPAFNLDGDGPRFCQDLAEIVGESLPVESLLIDSPGGKALEKNTDLLVKRHRFPAFGRPAAAMAVYTLQAWAPEGGSGYFTSLRGGGPLVTLVLPGARSQHETRAPLWHVLWANVPGGRSAHAAELPIVFPWLAPTRSGRGGGEVTALDGQRAHPLQAFWGMPWRIRLDLMPAGRGAACALTGREDAALVRTYRRRPGGVKYVNAAGAHPLTPTRRAKLADPEYYSVKPQADGIGYRHWHELAVERSAMRVPAAAVLNFQQLERRGRIERRARAAARLLAAGYDMEKAKARGFVEAEMPLLALEGDRQTDLVRVARVLATGATEAASLLRRAMRMALTELNPQSTPVDAVIARFYDLTDGPFWYRLRVVRDLLDRDADATVDGDANGWRRELRRHALALFDEAAPLDPLSPAAAGRLVAGTWRPSKIVEARLMLLSAFKGTSKTGVALFKALELPLPRAVTQ